MTTSVRVQVALAGGGVDLEGDLVLAAQDPGDRRLPVQGDEGVLLDGVDHDLFELRLGDVDHGRTDVEVTLRHLEVQDLLVAVEAATADPRQHDLLELLAEAERAAASRLWREMQMAREPKDT